jgi:predicted GIY-YIG superfamily endonuclease
VPEHSEAWEKGDEGVDKFFVYIIKHDGGFYKGHTRELKVRMSKHRDGLEPATKGKNPKLKYFEVLPSRDSAEKREVELKKLNDSEIRRLIIDFEGWIQELNKED